MVDPLDGLEVSRREGPPSSVYYENWEHRVSEKILAGNLNFAGPPGGSIRHGSRGRVNFRKKIVGKSGCCWFPLNRIAPRNASISEAKPAANGRISGDQAEPPGVGGKRRNHQARRAGSLPVRDAYGAVVRVRARLARQGK